ncbi:hypothetical protein PC112_g5913 [Phytophthora cactorum]|nr:hypothetical protein PC112_g5913 [Phytophthora cactorum]KAG3096384.1 hypothetical protein PC122_g4932 [Phytophthora cactorum]
MPPVAPVALETLESLPAPLKKLATAPPSETESEDDDSEVGGAPSVNKTPATSPSGHSKSLLDVRTRSNTTDGEIQRRQATRPRSTSRKREGEQPQSVETARGHGYDEQYQAQRALATRDVRIQAGRARRLDQIQLRQGGGRAALRRIYILERRLVSRRSHANSPKAN